MWTDLFDTRFVYNHIVLTNRAASHKLYTPLENDIQTSKFIILKLFKLSTHAVLLKLMTLTLLSEICLNS